MTEVELQILVIANKARDKYGQFASLHEALAVLEEEVSELRAIVYTKDRSEVDRWLAARVRAEAIDIAAVALRIANGECEFNR